MRLSGEKKMDNINSDDYLEDQKQSKAKQNSD